MATITIRNVPEPVHRMLKERAEKDGRSLNSELIQILVKEVSRVPEGDPTAMLQELRAFRESLPEMEPVSIEELREWIEDGRA